jgi:MFS transporter, CP family, cyanate transporter
MDGEQGRSAPPRALLLVALGLTGLTMRAGATSVGPVLHDLQRDLHVSGGVAGLITTLPVLSFAAMGALTPKLARRFGPHRVLIAALALSAAGLALRPLAGNALVFGLLTVLALCGAAISNVLMPSLVKRHFPTRIGPMTALYTTALAVGATAGAGLTVPIGDLTGGWRPGLGAWAVLPVLAVLPWLATLRTRDAADRADPDARLLTMSDLARSRTAWALTVFFGAQSMQAYIAFGWFARFLGDHDISSGTAGLMVAVFSAISIPVSIVTPRVPRARQRPVIAGFCAATLLAYAGMAVAPHVTAWPSMVLAGLGSGTFPMALTLIGQRSRTPDGTAALSAFVQVVGYLIAGTGPFLFGALFGLTDAWGLPLVVLFAAAVITFVASWPATADRFVDDEVPHPVPVPS